MSESEFIAMCNTFVNLVATLETFQEDRELSGQKLETFWQAVGSSKPRGAGRR